MARPRIQIILCAATILVFTGSTFANESVYKQVLPATAWIITPSGKGSGVLVDVDRKLVATNFHIVGLHSEVTVVFPDYHDREVIVERDHYLKDLRKLGIKAKVKRRDPVRDLALIELEEVPEGATALALAPHSASPGQQIHAIGNPGISEALWVYSTGSIRQVYSGRTVNSGHVFEGRMVQTQTPMNHGDSGGPVVNDEGQLVALRMAYRLDGGGSLFGLCVDVSELKSLLKGEIKSIDRQVASTLQALRLKYAINGLGDYTVDIPTDGGSRQVVVVESLTWPRGPLRVRNVYAISAPAKGLNADTTLRLLKKNGSVVFGSWSCILVDGKEHLAYRTIVPASSDADTMRDALKEATSITANAKRELAAVAARQKLLTQDR